MRPFEIEAIGMGTNAGSYKGQFTPVITNLIKSLICKHTLHLYSGSSLLGDERVDLAHPNASRNCLVEDFIKTDNRYWDWVILDPPYGITTAKKKLKGYANYKPLSASVPTMRLIKAYLSHYATNILWLDLCAPIFKPFFRRKLWFVFPGGDFPVRVLSWLQRETEEPLPGETE